MNTLEGWISLHRKLLDNPIVCKDSDYLAVWMYLLLQATHKNYEVIFKGERTTLLPGQLLTGRKVISKKFNISESKVQRILKTFEIEQQIKQQSSTQNRLITILKWDLYQKDEQQNGQRVNNERTTSEQRVNTNNNVNNDNNANNEIKINIADSIQNIINSWNDLNLTQIKTINPNTNRFKLLNTRLREYGESEIIKAINLIKECPFLLGQSQGGWIITFDWFIKPNNFVKVLEGTYKGKNDFKAKNSNQRLNVVDMRDDELKERLRQKMKMANKG